MSPYTYAIGDTGPAGGLVFYDKTSYTGTPAWRYMEAAPSDQSSGIMWNDGSNTDPNSSTAVGTGAANTAAIVAALGSGSYAAQLCADLILGGYDDWFLPSWDELNLMRANLYLQSLGGFSLSSYWSSSMECLGSPSSYIWMEYFGDGGQYGAIETNPYKVRAAREF